MLSSDSTYESVVSYNLVKKQKRNDKPIITMLIPTLCDWLSSSTSACESHNPVFTRLKVIQSKAESECSIHKIITLYASAYDSESDSFRCENQPSDDMKLA